MKKKITKNKLKETLKNSGYKLPHGYDVVKRKKLSKNNTTKKKK